MKVIGEVGLWGAARYVVFSVLCSVFGCLQVSPLRVFFLSLFGAKIGKNVVIENVRFFNVHKSGWGALSIGDNCYVGPECMLDLSGKIMLEKNVTVSARAALLTHTNVGYADHPLQKFIPKKVHNLLVKKGCFIGFGGMLVGVTVLAENTAIAAGSVVVKANEGNELLAGVPAKRLRRFSP